MTYNPILRFKRGEQTALDNLSNSHKLATIPLLNVTSHEFNPPKDSDTDANFDQRIIQDADKLNSIWAGYTAAVDMGDIDSEARCTGGVHPVRLFFDHIAASENKAIVKPVLRFRSDDEYVIAVASICTDYNIKPVFRITPDDLAEPDIKNTITTMLYKCKAKASDSALVVDMGYIETTGRSVITAKGALGMVPFVTDWDVLSLVSGSFPVNLSGFTVGNHIIERHEWETWLANQIASGRKVIYGDYATIHPIPADDEIDPRKMNPTASIRYTFNDKWLLIRGQGTRTPGSKGFDQFFHHADTLVNAPQYRGKDFSFGDNKIMRIHLKKDSKGSLETWVMIGVNHHISEIVDQLANLP